jgi:PHP family Zn ribbon phosphoesterase
LQTLRAELHIHTLLSPCADVEMVPPLIVQQAVDQGIGLIAITDHNATANIEAVQKAARGSGLVVLPGVELQTLEEVHVLCLFDELDQINALQKIIDGHLPDVENNIEYFGEQFVVDETGEFIRREQRLLLTSTNLSLHHIWDHTMELGGLMIPAHVNRKAFGLLQVLGFVPTDIPIEILEVSQQSATDQAALQFPDLARYPLVKNGDAHFLEDIKGYNQLTIASPTTMEIRRGVLGLENRSHKILAF